MVTGRADRQWQAVYKDAEAIDNANISGRCLANRHRAVAGIAMRAVVTGEPTRTSRLLFEFEDSPVNRDVGNGGTGGQW
jgi:hypothetical protein